MQGQKTEPPMYLEPTNKGVYSREGICASTSERMHSH